MHTAQAHVVATLLHRVSISALTVAAPPPLPLSLPPRHSRALGGSRVGLVKWGLDSQALASPTAATPGGGVSVPATCSVSGGAEQKLSEPTIPHARLESTVTKVDATASECGVGGEGGSHGRQAPPQEESEQGAARELEESPARFQFPPAGLAPALRECLCVREKGGGRERERERGEKRERTARKKGQSAREG